MENKFKKIIDDCKGFERILIWLDKDGKIKEFTDSIFVEKTNIGLANVWIDYDWYIQNKNDVEKLICEIVDNKNLKCLEIIHGQLVSDNIKKSIILNKSIDKLHLGCYENDKYNFTYQDYLDFMTSAISSIETPSIDEKVKLLPGYNNEKELLNFNANELIIDKDLSIDEIKKLILEFDIKSITISDDKYPLFLEIIELSKKLEKNIKILVVIKNKKTFNNKIFKALPKYNNIFINSSGEELPLSKYLEYEKLLYLMIEPAKNLSPFEKYIYAYNITKLFKKYKDNKDDDGISRDLYKVLDSEYIVCAGFANLFSDLLTKLGIENHYLREAIGKETNTGFKKGWHARVYSNIVDEKYGINGFYRGDPTWDNKNEIYYFVVREDYYNHLAFTDEEATNSISYLWINFKEIDELFNIKNIEEFYKKIGFLKKRLNISVEEICKRIINKLEKLDEQYVDYLLSRFKFINEENWPDDLMNLVNELGNYILYKVNNPISIDTVMKAVEVIYNHSYGYNNENYTDEDRRDLMELVREMNEDRQRKEFPYGEKYR